MGTKGKVCAPSEEGCMHWYLYSAKSEYVNMLLDHNITEARADSGTWSLEEDYIEGLTPIKDSQDNTIGYEVGEETDSMAISAGISYPNIQEFPVYEYETGRGIGDRGPLTALNTLKSLTTAWKTQTPKVPNSTSTNEYIIPSSKNENKYQIDYTGYKARLLTFEETSFLGCDNTNDSCPEWMIKNTYEEDHTIYAGILGYWTSTSVINENNINIPKRVSYARKTISSYSNDNSFGIRPVIAVNINDVL